MNVAQIEAFIQHWYRLIENRDPKQAAQRAERLVQTIFENAALKEWRDLQEMAERPLLLTLLIGLDSAGKSLNNSRPKVYSEIVDLLLQRWQENLKETLPALSPELQSGMRLLAKLPDALLKALQKAAYETYEILENRKASKNKEVSSGLEFPASVVLGSLSVPCEGGEKERHVLAFLQERSTLLMAGSQPDKLQFAHKSIHEYLAARYLLNDADWEEKITQHLLQNPSWWREVFLFMAKDQADTRYGSAVTFLYNVLLGQYQREALAQQWLLILAAEAALEMDLAHQHDKRSHENLYHFLQTELVAVLRSQELSIVERAEAGRLLGELGDPRQGVTIIKEGAFEGLPEIDWVTIPAGQLRMGSEEEDQEASGNEKPAHTVSLPTFQISRYPITNAQYTCFIEAGGYQQERYWQLTRRGLEWWQQAKVQAPKYWDRHQWNNPNHPVVGVSWYEALAYCQWLNETPLYQGKHIRLPQEDEWEYAARGEAGWCYAWGHEPNPHLGNYAATGLNQTSSVGLFPAGKAFQAADGSGVHDLSGNVWEWTTSQWGAPYELEFTYDKWTEQQAIRNYLDTKQEVHRIVRGGSWNYPTEYLRCAVRDGDRPSFRSYVLGFRVCAFSLAADC